MKTTGNEIREDERQKINPRNIFSEGLAVPKAGPVEKAVGDFNVIMRCSLIMEKENDVM